MTNTSSARPCRLKGTDSCEKLARGDCKVCPGGAAAEERIDELEQHVKAVSALLPEEGPQTLHESEECLLCVGRPRKKSCYALWDFGNVQPREKVPGLLGIQREAKVGAMVPLQFACCAKCRKNWEMLTLSLPACIAAGGGIGLATGYILPIRNALAKVHPVLPLGVFAGFLLLGWLCGTLLRRSILKKKGAETAFDVSKLPYVVKMKEKGWFLLMGGRLKRPVFSEHRRKRGWFC
ncbi:MAG: hypothetical protein ACOYIR_07805 [Christensenellales bacterium]|jgi:hypothetical protein